MTTSILEGDFVNRPTPVCLVDMYGRYTKLLWEANLRRKKSTIGQLFRTLPLVILGYTPDILITLNTFITIRYDCISAAFWLIRESAVTDYN